MTSKQALSTSPTRNRPPDSAVIGRVAGAVATFNEAFGKAVGDPLMPMQQVNLLLFLYQHGEQLQTALPDVTGTGTSAVSRNLLKLGSQPTPTMPSPLGLIESFIDPDNRKYRRVRLTEKGWSAVEAAARRAAVLNS